MAYHFGATLNIRDANVDWNYPYGVLINGENLWRTTKVGSYRPNAFNLYDMHGNVWEWCADRYADDYYRYSPPSDPTGPTSESGNVLRGGGWFFNAAYCRSASREYGGVRGEYYGFRVVLEVQ